MKGFLRKLSNATTNENHGIELKKAKMYNIIVILKFLPKGNTQTISSDRYFTNEDQAKKFCRIWNEACKKYYEKHPDTTLIQQYDYTARYLMIYDDID